jgi:hypothetical protein
MKIMLTKDALYFCTGVLFGKPGGQDGVTIFLDRQGIGGEKVRTDHLRLFIEPSGKLTVAIGDGEQFRTVQMDEIRIATVSSERFAFQEDLFRLDAPWWSSEVRVPLSALSPFKPGEPLRAAIIYKGTVPSKLRPGIELPEGTTLSETWPAVVDEFRPETWGKVTTRPLVEPQARAAESPDSGTAIRRFSTASANLRAAANDRTPISTALARRPFSTFFSPDVASFYHKCPAIENITLAELAAQASYAFDSESKWPMVDPVNRPVAQASGVVQKINVSPRDSVFIHESHDLDMEVSLEPEFRDLSLFTYSDTGISVSGGDTLKVETESLGMPPNINSSINARPKVDDHVTVVGRWIFDCGHEPKTEIHSVPFCATDRLEVRPLWPNGPLRTVKTVRIWMNSDPLAFRYTFDGPFDFFVDLPPSEISQHWMPFVRVTEGDASKLSWVVSGSRLHITVNPPQPTGMFFFEMVLGHLLMPTDSLSAGAGIFTVNFDLLTIFDDKDSGLVPDCGFDDCGEWYMATAINGIWRQLLWNTDVNDEDPPVSLESVQPVSFAGQKLSMQLTGYEDDDIEHEGGEQLVPDPDSTDLKNFGVSYGPAATLVGTPQTFPPGGGAEYELGFHVSSGGNVPTILVDSSFWAPLIEGEPNDERPTNLGIFPVPSPGGPPLQTQFGGHITEQGERFVLPDQTSMELLARDVDRFEFGLDDFGDISVTMTVPGLTDRVEYWHPTFWFGTYPSRLRILDGSGQIAERNTTDAVGYRGARVIVSSENGDVGRRAYGVSVNTTYRALPRDWGEDLDSQFEQTGQGGRLVDLATVPPDPNADPTLEIHPRSLWLPETRSLKKDWAWQHVGGDVDYYVVVFPAVHPPFPVFPGVRTSPPGPSSCVYDRSGRLIVEADGDTQLTIRDLDLQSPGVHSSPGRVIVENLLARFPNGGRLVVEVRHPNPTRRDFYRFSADWNDSRYYTSSECEELREMYQTWRATFPDQQLEFYKGLIALSGDRQKIGPRVPGGDPGPIDITDFGIFLPVYVADGDSIDLAVSSPENQKVHMRLYDEQGVMLGESVGFDRATQRQVESAGGKIPQQRLQVGGLRGDRPLGLRSIIPRGRVYFLQIVPESEPGTDSVMPISLSFTELPKDLGPVEPTQ